MPRVLPLTIVIAAALVVSFGEHSPTGLPGVALGSEVLLHLERAVAVFGIVVAVLSVLREAARGRLPTQLSTTGLGYGSDPAPATAAREASTELKELHARVLTLEEQVLGGDVRAV